jgi:tRNA-modifying protein YgfZ
VSAVAAAVPVESGPDAGAPWHYGDPYAEQRALAAGTAAVDLSHRPVLRVAGEDRLTWLHALTSQHLTQLPAGQWTQALILSPHGHVEHHLTLVDDGAVVLAHVEPGTLDALLAYLTAMVFWSKVEVADVSGAYGLLRSATGDELVPREQLGQRLAAYEQPAGLWAAEALRVEAGVPRLGFETDHRTIPAEVGWIGPAVHLDKGCYRGQETVARVHNLGRPPRRLVQLHLDGSDAALPTHADPVVTADGRTVGFIGTAARHYELGPIALALVKRTVEDGAALTVVAAERPGQVIAATPSTPKPLADRQR